MSSREELQKEIVAYLEGREDAQDFPHYDAPYGVLYGKSLDSKGRSIRDITFGKCRTLDASIIIYGPKFITLSWEGHVKDHARRDSEAFKSKEELLEFLEKNT